MKLRPYQQDVYNKITEKLKKGDKRILVLGATGFGKTILAKYIAKSAIDRGNAVLFTNHRISLVDQTHEKFKDLEPNIIQGTNRVDNNSLLTIASLQTLINVEISEPKVIIVDECHYAYDSKLIQDLFTRFPNSIYIGLSATPLDNKGYLLEGFDSIIDDYQTSDLIKLGALTPFTCMAPYTIDTSSVRVIKNEYNNKDLEEVVNKDEIHQTVVANYNKHGEGRKFICFGVSKKHCIELRRAFLYDGIEVEVIDADTSEKDRKKYFEYLKTGKIRGLISIEILTAGFDEPSVSCVILAMKTKMWKKYIQCAGRGIRLLGQTIEESITNGKRDCLLLDMCGNIAEHDLPDTRKEFKFKKKISKVIDKHLKIDEITTKEASEKVVISEEREVYLKRVGSVLDLYRDKVYTSESDLQADVNNFLIKSGLFWWRQNSGKMFKDGRWIHFASKSGLPDNTVFYKNTSIFFGIELKLRSGKLTKHQQETLPEMIDNNVLFFICESVYDVFMAIEHITDNIIIDDEFIALKKSVYNYPERELQLRAKLKLI